MKMSVTKTQLFWLPRATGIHFRTTEINKSRRAVSVMSKFQVRKLA